MYVYMYAYYMTARILIYDLSRRPNLLQYWFTLNQCKSVQITIILLTLREVNISLLLSPSMPLSISVSFSLCLGLSESIMLIQALLLVCPSIHNLTF